MAQLLTRGSSWAVVCKPSALFVHRTALARDRDVLLTRVRDTLGQHVHPIHRLDRATSGCVLFGLSREAIPSLQEALTAGAKTYVVLCRGEAAHLDGTTIDRPLKHKGRIREAATRFEVLATLPEPRCSLLLAYPTTGRFHQIRRHLAGVSHPVLGDSSHGDTKCNRSWHPHGLGRLALHCARLQLSHPDGPIEAIAPIPDDLVQVLGPLGLLDALPGWLRPSR